MFRSDAAGRALIARLRRYAALGAFAALVLFSVVAFRGVMLPFILAIFAAYLFAPVVDRVLRTRLRGHSLSRWAAVGVVYSGGTALLVLAGLTLVPTFIDELARMAETLPSVVLDARTRWLPDASASLERLLVRALGSSSSRGGFDLERQVAQSLEGAFDEAYAHAGDALVWGRALIEGVLHGVTTALLTGVLTAFLLADAPRILRFVRSLVPQDRAVAWDRLLVAIDRGLSGVIRGQLILCVLNGILAWIGFLVLGVPFALVLGLLAGVLSLIPIFGAVLSAVPAVLLALTVGPWTPLLVVAWVTVAHLLIAAIVGPTVLGSSARIHPVVIVFALLAGEHGFGLAGALLAVPCVSVVQTLFLHFRDAVIGTPGAAREAVPGAEVEAGPSEGAA